MRLSYAFLADYARVENAKVYVIGGGVTVLWREEFPAVLGVTIVLSFAYNSTEAGSERSIKIQVNDADGNEIIPALEGTFVLPARGDNVPSTVPLEAAFAISTAANIAVIPDAGNYVIEVSADGNHLRSLPFAAVPLTAS
jgi:hypothetical protein